MKKILLSLVTIPLFVFTFTNCGTTPSIPEPICDYGAILCDFGEELCNSGVIPPDICYYVNLSCINLNYLCSTNLTEEDKNKILETQRELNSQIKSYIEQKKKVNNE